MTTPSLSSKATLSLAIAALLFAVTSSFAATVYYIGTNGVSATTNWSDTANWLQINTSTPTTPANNEANFNWNTMVNAPGLVTLNVDGGYGTPGSGVPQAWGMYFTQTNGYQTALVQPGIVWSLQAANATPGGGNLAIDPGATNNGGSSQGNSPGIMYTNYTTFTGIGGTFFANTATMRIEGQCSVVTNHYTIWDMSGLGTYIFTNTAAASQNFYCSDGQTRSHVLIYLAHTNFITLNAGQMHIGNLSSTSSNSQPIGVYLGQTNYIQTGSSSSNLLIGGLGCSNAFMRFNPTYIGGATMPTAYITGIGGVQNAAICSTVGGAAAGSAMADFTGGNVTWIGNTLDLGVAGSGSITANGTLSFDNGIVNFNNVVVGSQTASGGAAGAGIINVGTNAILQVNNKLILGATVGTINASTSGTINVNTNGMLQVLIITNGGAGSTINLTNAILAISVTNTSMTNIVVANFNATGTTNVINIPYITPLLGAGFPVRFHLINSPNLVGTATFGLGSLPVSYDPSHPYVANLDTSTPGVVDLVLTAGPPSARSLTWIGTNALGAADGDWDLATTPDWLTGGAPTTYNQFDLVTFADVASTSQTNVNLTTTLTPYSLLVSNNASRYTFDSTGNIAGTEGITKAGTNTLILDNTGSNSYSGTTLISGGVLQVGTNDTGGNLPDGNAVTDNSVLAFDRTDSIAVSAVISGSGAVVAGGGGTVQLAGANTFTGNAIATNSTTLQGGFASSFGTGAGSVVVANGSTLDPKGTAISKGVSVSGTGVGGNGAIVDSGGAIFDSAGGLTPTLTLTGNTLLSYPSRWDLGGAGATTATLSTGGNPYNLTLNGDGNYFEWRNVQCDSKLGDIYLQSGTLGYVGSTTAGNPTNSLVISNGTGMTFYNGSVNPTINKIVVVQDGGNINVGAGGATITGTLALNNVNSSQFCKVTVGSGLTLTISNVTGNGIFYVPSGGGNIVINGNASAFTGGVDQFAGLLYLANVPFGSGITNSASCVFQGSGTVAGVMDIASPMTVGTPTAAGSLTNTGLVLEGSATLTNNLGGATTIGGGVNSYIQVNGPLTVNGNNIIINPLAPLVNGTYTLMTVTGGITGTFGTAGTAQASSYTFTLNTVPSGPNTLVQLVVSGGQPSVKIWNNNQGNGEFDVNVSQNWSNATSHVAADYFLQFDNVLLDDSISLSTHPSASLDIASGQSVTPSILTNNSATNNYTISGAGSIAGLTSIVKLGSSTLTISTTNSFTGNVTVAGGVLKAGPNASLGATTGTVYVTNGATLDIDYSLGTKPLVVSGNGINGLGALVNNDTSGTPVYDNPGGLLNVTLAGNTTIGGTNRIDFGKFSPNTGVVSSSGNNYSLTVVGPTYREWDNVAFDANFGNINIMNSVGGAVGIKGSTSLGNPTNLLTVFTNSNVTLYQDTTGVVNVVLNKSMKFNGGSTLANGAGANAILSPISIGSNSSDTVTFNIGGTSLTVSNVISGAGNLSKTGSSPLYLTATNTYTGNTVISGSPLVLTNNGSISSSANILLGSGQVLDAGGRSDGTLTLALGQTLGGAGTIDGSLLETGVAVLVVGSGNGTGTLTVTNNVNLQGTTSMGVGVGSNNLLTCASIAYGGTLSLSFIPGSLTNGNTFKLFNSTAASYTGSFSIVPSTPGAGLVWDTSQLNTTGTLGIMSSGGGLSPATFGASVVAGTNLTLNGTGGTHSGTYHVYSSTNLTIPLTNWILGGTGSFDTNGNFSFVTNISTGTPANFYILKEP